MKKIFTLLFLSVAMVAIAQNTQIVPLGIHKFQMNEQVLNEKMYSDYLNKYCHEAYKQFNLGSNFKVVGLGLFGVGSVMTISGFDAHYLSISTIGISLGIAGIGFFTSGVVFRRISIKTYNNSLGISKVSPLTLSFQTSQNGLGLALNF